MKYSRFRSVSRSSIEENENGSNNNNDGDEHEEGDVKDQGEGKECEQVVEGGEIDIEGGPGCEGEDQDGPGSEGEDRGGPGSLSLTPDIVKGRGDEEEEDNPRNPGAIVTTSRLPDMLDHTPHSQGEPDR